MTDDELKVLVARIAVAQERTDAQMARTDVKLDQLAGMYGGLVRSQERTDAQIAETNAQLAKTSAKLDRVSEMCGGVGNNQGAVAEEFFYNTLDANPVLGGVRFRSVHRNVTKSFVKPTDEFDLVLVGGEKVFVAEVKYKAHEKDLWRLLDVKAPNFRGLFPDYADRELQLGLAAFHVHDALKSAALAQGVTVLQRKGDLIEASAA